MRKIKRAKILFLSLCPEGKNRMSTFLKSDGSFQYRVPVKKAENFKIDGELIAAVYVPNLTDTDGEGTDSEQVIKEMAYSHAKNGGKLDIMHDSATLKPEEAFLAESFLIQKGDPRFEDLKDDKGNIVDPTGGWGAIVKLEDPNLLSLYKEEGWQGISMGGFAEFEPEESTHKAILDQMKNKIKENRSMDEKQVMELIQKALAPFSTLQATVEKLIKAKDEKPEPEKKEKKDEPPVFEGDPLNKEDVTKHEEKLQRYTLQKAIDWSDPAKVKEYSETLNKKKEEDPKKELARLEEENKTNKERIAVLEKGSNQNTKEKSGEKEENYPGFDDEAMKLVKKGRDAAKAVNPQTPK